MVLEILPQAITVAQSVYSLCRRHQDETVETRRGTIKLVGEKMNALVGVLLRASSISEAPIAGFQVALYRLLKEIDYIHKSVKKAVTLSRPIYALRAKGIRHELETKMRNIEDYVDYLNLAHDVKLSEKIDAMQDTWAGLDYQQLGTQLRKKEREEKAVLLRILNEDDEQLQASELARLYGLREHTDLADLLAESHRGYAETQRKLRSTTDAIALDKAKADNLHMAQLISALIFASEHAAQTVASRQSITATAPPEIPEWCICPISCCVMVDPVHIDSSCHHTFERSQIYDWVVTHGNTKCPMDNIRLRSNVLSPNAAIRGAIATWQQNLMNASAAASSGRVLWRPTEPPTQETEDLKAQVEAMRAQMEAMQPPVIAQIPTTSLPAARVLGPLQAGHTDDVWCCSVFENGQKALSGSSDNTLRVWNLVTGQTIQVLTGHMESAWCCTVFDNGHKALSASTDNTLRVWNLATGETSQTLTGHAFGVTCCAVFDNGQQALSGSGDSTLRVWNLATGETMQTLMGHTLPVCCCAVFSNGQKALSASIDNTLRVWSLATGETIQTLTGHTQPVNCCAVFENGQKALSGSWDKTLRVWNLATGETIQALSGHTDWVRCCAVFDNGQKALSGSKDNTLRVWNLATGEIIQTLMGHKQCVECCAVFDNGQKALSGGKDNTLRVWDLSPPTIENN